jgi:hypothetical protein
VTSLFDLNALPSLFIVFLTIYKTDNCVWEGGSKKLKNLQSIFLLFQAILSLFFLKKKQNLFFCDFKLHAKFRNTTITPSWRKASGGEEEEKKMPLIVDTPLGPMIESVGKIVQ